MTATEDFAPAKVNLSLHVIGRRPDGYHLLDSIVVFASVGDRLRADPAEDLSLAVTGPMAGGVPTTGDNLVHRAARLLDPVRGAAITLEKHLPAAGGIGGGSSDAAAALRMLSALWGMPVPRNSALLGADVPMCLDPRAARVSGTGEHVVGLDAFPELPAVLVNPGESVPTPACYGALERRDNAPMPEVLPRFGTPAEAAGWLARQRNDLTAPARGLAPVIDDVLASLDDALLARMSGSGPTCFGLYPDTAQAGAAADRIAAARPDWWVRATVLNPATVPAFHLPENIPG